MQVARARSAVGRSLVRPRPTVLSAHGAPSRAQVLRRFESTEAAPLTPPPSNFKSKSQRFLQVLGGVTLVTIVGSGVLYYYAQKDRSPGPQLPHDPTKKTIVVLGSGWGATSLLKGLDTTEYNVIVVSPKNYFLFTPLLPSVAVGTLTPKAILQPTRYVTRHKPRQVSVIEATATNVDPIAKTVTFADTSEIQGQVSSTTIQYDYLVYAVGAEVQTFNIPGVRENACFMKEMEDAEKTQRRFLDCLESAAFPGQSKEEIDRLLHVVVVGGGPTGVELSGEIHDFLEEDLRSWYPELANHIRISLVEALPSVLPSFSKQLIEYTESTFKEAKIDILTKTMVKEVREKSVVLQKPDKSIVEVPCGLVVWAAGNTHRKITRDLMAKLPEHQTNRRGITVDEYLRMAGTDGSIFALGDCTATSYAPTAQVASQQGRYLARVFEQLAKRDNLQARLQLLETAPEAEEAKAEKGSLQKQLAKAEKLRPFHYSHQGSLAYIGSEKAIADLPFFNGNLATGGVATYLFWRSAYISNLFSWRNRVLVLTDWGKVKLFGRDVSRE
ncbi:FAD/NAD-P-binding domain-containing protein [Obba rivulosa]|uniref:NADH:ubiquinone reductase (non-electrogenic) n=1 Tax=Obba rivulosa TaxID=1052685 RepID=A0A8E2B0F1_9APHY|nr:FAD/NAD-P-binding domain-containing protein [Obba rivulosa]